MNFPLIAGTALAMLAFAGNSVLCRLALEQGIIDPASFTSVRILSGALMLVVLLLLMPQKRKPNNEAHPEQLHSSLQQKNLFRFAHSTWSGGLALFFYAAGFSFAYITLPAGTGALILFATVQITMLSSALLTGSRLAMAQWIGFVMALLGLVFLLLPGISSPPLFGSVLMMIAGISWGIYSILGKSVINPTRATTENFIRAILPALLLSLLFMNDLSLTTHGVLLAITSGALTSGIGYAIWYAVLPHLKAESSASLQLTVPVIATMGGVIWLGETVTLRLVLASAAILGGVAMVVLKSKKG